MLSGTRHGYLPHACWDETDEIKYARKCITKIKATVSYPDQIKCSRYALKQRVVNSPSKTLPGSHKTLRSNFTVLRSYLLVVMYVSQSCLFTELSQTCNIYRA